MCAVSAIHDFVHDHMPYQNWDRTALDQYKELVRRLKEVDDKLGLPDCDPTKGEFLKMIERKIDAIEKKLKTKKTPRKRKPPAKK